MSFFKLIVSLNIVVALFILSSGKCTGFENVSAGEIKVADNPSFQQVVPPPIPQKISFAGEEVPLHNFDVRESLDRELMVNAYFHSQTMRYMKLAPRFFEVIVPILKEQGVPEDFKYLAMAESGFDVRALSPAGAAGVWQFIKETGKINGLEINAEVDERYHLEKSTVAACKYLKTSYAKYKNWTIVAASYNAGIAGVNRQLQLQGQESYYDILLTEETNRYVFRILAFKAIFESPEKYGYYISEADKYPTVPFDIVKVDGPIPSLADFAKKHKTNYKLLKMFNPWLRDTILKNELKKSYKIKIPKGELREY